MKLLPKLSIAPWVATAAAGLMVGYLTGVSSTPVAGAVATSVFGGLIGAATGFLATKQGAAKAVGSTGQVNGYGAWPATLFAFSVLFILGTLGGGYIRDHWAENVGPSTKAIIPWENSKCPNSPEDAWKWLTFAKDASAEGLEADQIQKIYVASLTSPGVAPDAKAQPTWPSLQHEPRSGTGGARLPGRGPVMHQEN